MDIYLLLICFFVNMILWCQSGISIRPFVDYFGQEQASFSYTLKRIYNWPPSFCYILGKVFGEKYK